MNTETELPTTRETHASLNKPMLVVWPEHMANKAFRVDVYEYLFGQYRIMVSDAEDYMSCRRELDTYDLYKLDQVIKQLKSAPDPLAFVESLETTGNCEYQGGRIRLDNGWEKSENGPPKAGV